MSNFTKSIFYSGTVLAVGLIAIFMIYNNTVSTGASVADIEPASGVEFGTVEPQPVQDVIAKAEAIAEDVIEGAADAVEGTMESIEETMEAAAAKIEDATTTSPAEQATTRIELQAENAGEAIEETAEAATEAVEDVQSEIEAEADAGAFNFNATEPAAGGDSILDEIEKKIGE